jgi:hypothetical protein
MPWPKLGEIIEPGPGHLVMVLGAPGVGKSAFALKWALDAGGPALVISQDTDLPTQAARTVSALAGVRHSEVVNDLDRWENFLSSNMKSLPLMYDYPIASDDIGQLIVASEEFFGITPAMVVIDVFKNVVREKSYEGYINAIEELHRAARRYGTCILLLHHVNRQGRNASGVKPIRLDDGQYGGEGDAEIVLGIWSPKGEIDPLYGWKEFYDPVMRVSVLKNRFGAKDPEGKDVYVDMQLDYDRMVIDDGSNR